MPRVLKYIAALSCIFVSNVIAGGPPVADTGKVATGKATPPMTTDTLVVTARLAEVPGKFAPNDLYDYVYIMKYRVLKVEKGSFNGSELLVGHYNPLIARKKIDDKMNAYVDGTVERFVVGVKHRLTLIAPIERVWDGAVEDEYIDVDMEKYYALRADALP